MKTTQFNIVDLTHALLPSIPSWDGNCGYRLKTTTDYKDCTSPNLFRLQEINTRAGMGTHIDAPAHCFEGAETIDGLVLDNLIAPCVVIKARGTVTDKFIFGPKTIEEFEEGHGRIQPGSFAIVSSGWSRYWNTPEKYRNDLQFPSIDEDAAALLMERGIVGLGIDTLSPDAGGKDFPVHRVILGSGKYIVENVANSELLPATGATVFAMPMKIFDGTEAPIRIIALTDRK
jgi:kynurenine formamidase